jgi:hypothetical protein
MIPPAFLLNFTLATGDLLWFHTYFRISFFYFVKNVTVVLIGIETESVDQFG